MRLRSIPACTGQPTPSCGATGFTAVYPRVYGAAYLKVSGISRRRGLSPRVRGSRKNGWCRCVGRRSIPACTGQPQPEAGRTLRGQVYPRVYGAAVRSSPMMSSKCGLSPRVRGSPHRWTPVRPMPGSIPACTGQPPTRTISVPMSGVYPRVYGAARSICWGIGLRTGLSPRVRGSHIARVGQVVDARSIPACTGQPAPAHCRCPPPGVYPRVYGAAIREGIAGYTRKGLSPRVRGSRREQAKATIQERSIPACTGQPASLILLSGVGSVYPRVYGAAAVILSSPAAYGGLSPRVRGSRQRSSTGRCSLRSIPACTGQPVALGWGFSQPRVYPRVYGAASPHGSRPIEL